MLDLLVSVVTFNQTEVILRATVQSVLLSDLNLQLEIIDHSPTNAIQSWFVGQPRVKYFHDKGNPGFGSGHNRAMKKSHQMARYHLVLNPDVEFNPSILRVLIDRLDSDPSIGLISPLVRYPTGERQPLCKLLPSPLDPILRRFAPNSRWTKKRDSLYELRDLAEDREYNIPSLSGCFLLMRNDMLRSVGLFDERYFMYFEDIDFCRRVHSRYKTIYYPFVQIVHHYTKGSYRSRHLLMIHILSAIKYFVFSISVGG